MIFGDGDDNSFNIHDNFEKGLTGILVFSLVASNPIIVNFLAL